MKIGSNNQNVHMSGFQNYLQPSSNLYISFSQSQFKKDTLPSDTLYIRYYIFVVSQFACQLHCLLYCSWLYSTSSLLVPKMQVWNFSIDCYNTFAWTLFVFQSDSRAGLESETWTADKWCLLILCGQKSHPKPKFIFLYNSLKT